MKKTITFKQLKRLVNEGKYRDDEQPNVSIDDMPLKLKDALETQYNAEIADSDNYKYLYVMVPLNATNSRGGTRLRNGTLGEIKALLKKYKWHLIDTEEAFAEEPRFTLIISPYENPSEPFSDYLDRSILKMQKQDAEQQARYAQYATVKEDGDGEISLFEYMNSESGEALEEMIQKKIDELGAKPSKDAGWYYCLWYNALSELRNDFYTKAIRLNSSILSENVKNVFDEIDLWTDSDFCGDIFSMDDDEIATELESMFELWTV